MPPTMPSKHPPSTDPRPLGRLHQSTCPDEPDSGPPPKGRDTSQPPYFALFRRATTIRADDRHQPTTQRKQKRPNKVKTPPLFEATRDLPTQPSSCARSFLPLTPTTRKQRNDREKVQAPPLFDATRDLPCNLPPISPSHEHPGRTNSRKNLNPPLFDATRYAPTQPSSYARPFTRDPRYRNTSPPPPAPTQPPPFCSLRLGGTHPDTTPIATNHTHTHRKDSTENRSETRHFRFKWLHSPPLGRLHHPPPFDATRDLQNTNTQAGKKRPKKVKTPPPFSTPPGSGLGWLLLPGKGLLLPGKPIRISGSSLERGCSSLGSQSGSAAAPWKGQRLCLRGPASLAPGAAAYPDWLPREEQPLSREEQPA